MQNSILVVDDDPFILDATATLLREEGYQVHVAQSGQRALQQVSSTHLFLIDNQLGDMTGLDLFDQIIQRTRTSVHAIMISGTLPAQEELKKRAIIGLEKPYDIQQLLSLIDRLLSQQELPERICTYAS